MAAKKARSDKRKAYQAWVWKQAADRKADRRAAQEVRTRANAALRAAGKLTPWEEAKAKRLRLRSGVRGLPAAGGGLS